MTTQREKLTTQPAPTTRSLTMTSRSDARFLRRQARREAAWDGFGAELRQGLKESGKRALAAADDAPNHDFKHGQHIFLTAITAGAWAPVWFFAHDMHRRERLRRLRAQESTHAVPSQRAPEPGGTHEERKAALAAIRAAANRTA